MRDASTSTTVTFSDKTMRGIEILAQREDVTIEELFARAFQSELFFQEQREKNREVLVKTPEGNLLEIKVS